MTWAVVQPCKLPPYLFLIRLQPCDHSQISNSSYLSPFLYELMYRDFREAPKSADFEGELWGLPQFYQQFFICSVDTWDGLPLFYLFFGLWDTFWPYWLAPFVCQPCPPFPHLTEGYHLQPLIPSLNISSVWSTCWQKCFASLGQVDPVSSSVFKES